MNKLNKVFSIYKFICNKYFFISYIIVLSLLPLMYYNIEVNTIFIFLIDDLSNSQIAFFTISNFLIYFFYHKIINKLYKNEYSRVLTVIWILPLLSQSIHIIYHITYYIYVNDLYLKVLEVIK